MTQHPVLQACHHVCDCCMWLPRDKAQFLCQRPSRWRAGSDELSALCKLSRSPLHSGPREKPEPDLRSHAESNQTRFCNCLLAGSPSWTPKVYRNPQEAAAPLSSHGTAQNRVRRGSQHLSLYATVIPGIQSRSTGMVRFSPSSLYLASSSPPKQGGSPIQFILPSLYFIMMWPV